MVTPDAPSSGGQGDARVTSDPDTTMTRQGDTLATADLVALLRDREARIDQLTVQLVATTEAATVWQERAGTLAERLTVAESRILALMPPESPVASNLTPLARFRACASWLLSALVIVAVVVLLLTRLLPSSS
jgi:hypothetical protein